MEEPLQPTQNRKRITLALCILTYVMAYLCRLNFSSAVLKIGADFGAGTATMGTVGALFFIAYALGQLINGFIGDTVSPVRFLIIATLGTGMMNLLMFFADRIWLIALIWVMNGYFQSIFWAACNRILSYYYGAGEHHVISMGMSLSMVASYLLSWVVLGKLLLTATWQSYFLIPALVAAVVLALWFCFGRLEKSVAATIRKAVPPDRRTLGAVVRGEGLWLICFSCLFVGIIKEGIGLWAPVIFLSVLGNDIDQSLLLLVLIPLGNFGGILLTGELLKRLTRIADCLLIPLMGVIALLAVGILLLKNISPYGAVFLTAAISGLVMGCNSILMSYLPLSYASQNIVSSLIGIFDSCAYVGAAISGYVLGIFLDHSHWQIIPLFWLIAALGGACFVALRRRILCRREQRTGEGSQGG
ncbi:MAG TPA: MFS transporter [Clostridiales bacterium]|nr:MFS transporter [Clostridiales bacterium]